jgi:hypothetical protein
VSVYEVTGTFRFRDHDPGEVFEAILDPVQERRALIRGNIRILEASRPTLQPGSYTLPRGWADSTEEVQNDE